MIYTGIGDKLGIFIQWSTTFVAGIVIAFVRHWELTLLLLLKEGAFVGLSKLLSKLLSKVGDTMRSILSHIHSQLLHLQTRHTKSMWVQGQ